VNEYWIDEFSQVPDTFELARPIEMVAVATLSWIWVFIRPSADDSVQVAPNWEHEVLADFDFMRAPKGYRRKMASQHALEELDWRLFDEQEVAGSLGALSGPQFYLPEERGQQLADRAGSAARLQLALEGEFIDEEALKTVRARLDQLEHTTNAPRRGKDFEVIMQELLSVHGCVVERGLRGEAEQVDLFMIDPQYALIECRWEKDPQEATAIRELGGKLDTRPSIVAGLYVSMSGFTDGARTIAQQMHERAVVLMNRDDILALAEGMMTFQAFWRERMRELVVRYPK